MFMLLAFTLSAFALESNTVPTSQLVASFAISPDENGMAAVAADLVKISAENGSMKEEALTLSADEKIVFAVNGTSITYDAADTSKNVLPLVPGGVYAMNFKRANGEVFNSAVKLPDVPTFTSPALNSVFKKPETVVAKWLDVPHDMAILFMASNCSIGGVGVFNDDFTEMELPGGWASTCSGPVRVELGMVKLVRGSGFGSIVGASMSNTAFSYDAETRVRKVPVPQGLSQHIFRTLKEGSKTSAIFSKL